MLRRGSTSLIHRIQASSLRSAALCKHPKPVARKAMLLKEAARAKSKPRCLLLAALVRTGSGSGLVPARLTPHDEPNLGRGGVAERRGPDSDFTVGGPPVAFWPL